MHRKDKEITDQKEIDQILADNTICRIALCRDNIPYIIPMNYGYGDGKIFLHSANQGRKLDIISSNNRICFEITDSIEIVRSEKACDFGTKYRSAIGFGTVNIISDYDKKKYALDIIMDQCTGKKSWTYSTSMLSKIVILEISIDSISAKKSGY